MKLTYFLLGLAVGSLLTYMIIDINFRQITEPKQVMASKLHICDFYGKKALNYRYSAPNETIKGALNYLNLSRDYFLCIEQAYGFQRLE